MPKFTELSVGGTGGGGSIIEVNELPTANIDESKIYVVNKISNIEVFYCYGSDYMTLGETIASVAGAEPPINYEVVSELPASPNVTNLQTFYPVYCYIYNNVPYVYGNAGSGNMWIPVSALMTQMGTAVEDKGRTYDIASETEVGLYTCWADKTVGTPSVIESYSLRNAKWISNTRYKDILLRKVEEITEDDLLGFLIIPAGFQSVSVIGNSPNEILKKVSIPNSVEVIDAFAFYQCVNLVEISMPSIQQIGEEAFHKCEGFVIIELPDTLRYIGARAFDQCFNLKKVVFGSGISQMWGGFESPFVSTNLLEVLDFRKATTIPELLISNGQGVSVDLPSTCKIVVPDSLYNSWIVARGWNYHASQIIKASEYTE